MIELPGTPDSNSPAFWDSVGDGLPRLQVLTSWFHPQISGGAGIGELDETQPILFDNQDVNGGIWMEGVVKDDRGVLYGYYHNEPYGVCPGGLKTIPRIGAARSFDSGRSWEDLGIVLEDPFAPVECDAPNGYFAGGVGDLSVILNHSGTELYFFFSSYSVARERQGVSVARMPWFSRDFPRGMAAIWSDGDWQLPGFFTDEEGLGGEEMVLPDRSPLFETQVSWYDLSGEVDSFWGPSVHWNTYLRQYVMLLNRASDSTWTQEGIYVSFSPVLDEPGRWTEPTRVLRGGSWYPQVIGLTPGEGTDKLADQTARFFMGGRSDYIIEFLSPSRR